MRSRRWWSWRAPECADPEVRGLPYRHHATYITFAVAASSDRVCLVG